MQRERVKPPLKNVRGVAINRLEMISIPVPNLNLLWSDLHTRDKEQVEGKNVKKYTH